MRTGEGKTLTATLPLFVHALSRPGAVPATSKALPGGKGRVGSGLQGAGAGLPVGVIQSDMSREQRLGGYQCSITYGTMKEFGFSIFFVTIRWNEMNNGGRCGTAATPAKKKPQVGNRSTVNPPLSVDRRGRFVPHRRSPQSVAHQRSRR